MSQENVEIVRRGFECFFDGDLDGWLELVHPEIRWDISAHPLPDVPDRGQGREAWAREFLGTYLSGWIDYSVQVKRSLQSGMPMSSLFFTKRQEGPSKPPGCRSSADFVLEPADDGHLTRSRSTLGCGSRSATRKHGRAEKAEGRR